MHTKQLAYGLMLLALLLAGCGQQAPVAEVAKGPAPAEDLAALKAAMIDGYVAASNAGYAAALASIYTDDAVIMPSDVPLIQGKAAIEAYFQKTMEGRKEKYSATSISLTSDDSAIHGDWAYVRGTSLWTATPKAGGAPIERRGKFLTIYKRQPDRSWKVFRGCSNRDHPPIPPPK
jgi:uncharacterized protein (TIGR02246 family)